MGQGYIHGHVAYAAGTTAPGATLAFLPTADGELRPYDGNQTGNLLGIMASHSDPAASQYIDFDVPQLPAFQEQKIHPLADNNDSALAGCLEKAVFPLNGLELQNGYTLEPKGVSSGSDMFGFVLHVGYGKPLGYKPGIIIRRRAAISLNKDVWTAQTTPFNDLDPNAEYGVRGMQVLPTTTKQIIAARLVMAETSIKPAVTVGNEVDFVKEYGSYAAIITGRSLPYFECLAAEDSATAGVILVLEQLSSGLMYSPANVGLAPVNQKPNLTGGRINRQGGGNGMRSVRNAIGGFFR